MIEVNTLLTAKTGNIFGNAIVYSFDKEDDPLHEIVTDYGLVLRMTVNEVRETFEIEGKANTSHKHHSTNIIVTGKRVIPNVFPKQVHEYFNQAIKESGCDTNMISDGYHTFGELYEHRIVLYIKLCNLIWKSPYAPSVWKSKKHSDGSEWNGWFILGIQTEKGEQISYHLPMSKWDNCEFAIEIDKAPDFDGHTSADVLDRIKKM